MTQSQYLQERIEVFPYRRPDSILWALINALSPKEACRFLNLNFEQNYFIRRAVLRKIAKDISNDYLPEHKKLLSYLMVKFDEKGFKKKESCAFSLDVLYDGLPSKEKGKILTKFLYSDSIRDRKRAYKRLFVSWNKRYYEIVLQVWKSCYDKCSIPLIIRYFPDDFFVENQIELKKYVGDYDRLNLLLRFAKIDTAMIEELRHIEPLSYICAIAKSKGRISESVAREICGRVLSSDSDYKEDRTKEILIWSLGQLGLWSILTELDEAYSRVHKLPF